MNRTIRTLLVFLGILMPLSVSAHEVYVLTPETVEAALAANWQNPFSAYFGNEYHFMFWGLISFITMTTILAASLFRLFERQAGPFLSYIKRFSHPVVRITIGLCLIGFGTTQCLFGTELPFQELFGAGSSAAGIIMTLMGISLIAGLWTRYIALTMIALYAYALSVHGAYILTYTDHLGAYIFLFALGAGRWSVDHSLATGKLSARMQRLSHALTPYVFPILRVGFGFGVMYAAIYAKFLHSELALQTVIQYHLTDYFAFTPLFVVLGALIIEFLAGLMLVLGIAIRWTGLFLIFWLTLSQIYFGEQWWLHLVLFGLGLALFCHGYDRYSIEGWLLKRKGSEPIF